MMGFGCDESRCADMALTSNTRIGVYGGAFNPVHWAHLRVAEAVTRYLDLDLLLWVPTGIAWHKPVKLAAAKDRVAMLELAFEEVTEVVAKKWQIETLELERQDPSYTIETLEQLQQKYKAQDWYLIIGADQLFQFQTWKRWQDVIKCSKLAVVDRLESSVKQDPGDQNTEFDWVAVPFEQVDISSSHIRLLLNQYTATSHENMGEALIKSLPRGVWSYIQEHHLYVE